MNKRRKGRVEEKKNVLKMRRKSNLEKDKKEGRRQSVKKLIIRGKQIETLY
jgi:hypothetical protein